ncbi:formyltransferase family protein [Gelidibacter japonicus]|uniref:formyltransferase family protein n=1 Tax=Gelidibacter japonicus TaxID=1962232 RepID=UPI003A8CA031
MKCAILTSGDLSFAGDVFWEVQKRASEKEFIFVNVYKNDSRLDLKPLKIFFLFGLFGTILFLLNFLKNSLKFYKVRNEKYFRVEKNNIDEFLSKNDVDQIILVNYAWLFNAKKYPGTVNCHPGPLPDFKGLMPICYQVKECLLNRLNIKTTSSIHIINEKFDEGILVFQSTKEFPKNEPLYNIYLISYKEFVEGINCYLKSENIQIPLSVSGRYFNAMKITEVFKLKILILLNNSFFKFLINGGAIGVISWILQAIIYKGVTMVMPDQPYGMTISVWLAFSIVVFINFASLGRFVFQNKGYFVRFSIVTSVMIFFVGILSEWMLAILSSFSFSYATVFAYPISALIVAPLSFFIKKKMVFSR